VSGKRLVWSCGQRVVKALTLPADVIQALWCPFPEDRGGGAAEDSERRAAAKWLCALTSRELHAVSPSGEMHVVALPFRAEKMWEAGGRILLHAEPGARKQGPALRCGAPPCRAGSARPRPHLRAVPRPSLAPPRVTRRAPPGDCRCSSPWITPLTPRARSAAWRRGRRTKSRSRGCWFAFPTRPPSRERSSVIIGESTLQVECCNTLPRPLPPPHRVARLRPPPTWRSSLCGAAPQSRPRGPSLASAGRRRRGGSLPSSWPTIGACSAAWPGCCARRRRPQAGTVWASRSASQRIASHSKTRKMETHSPWSVVPLPTIHPTAPL
jgi:hypothetical protein